MTNKKSGNLTQPGCHYNASTPKRRNRKHENIVTHTTKFYKRLNRKGRVFVATSCILTAFLAGNVVGIAYNATTTPEPQKEIVIVEKEPVTGYELTELERWTIASVVTAEAGGEPYAGKMAVAQCIYQAVKDDGIRPVEAIEKYKYTSARPEPTEEAMQATVAIFEKGQTVTAEPIKYFYSPGRVQSGWHESQNHVLTINGHRFFSEK